jgi:hypothetical protein
VRALAPRVLLAALAALVLAGPAAADRWESIESLPGRAPEIVKVKGKSRVYFRLTAQKPIAVTLAGPARLRVISRAVLAKGGGNTAAYQIVALEGGKALRAAHEEAGAAAHVSAPGIPALAHGRTMILEVPDGTHRVELRLAGTAEVLVRLQRAAPAGSEAWVSLTPVRASRSVSVIEGEKTIAYYSVRQGQPVALRVVGPTTLDVLARLDFDATMRGAQSYRLVFAERGRTVREAEFRTTKAAAATFSNLADRVPSKFDRLSLPVGPGLHEIDVSIVSPPGGVAEIHARIPQPAVGTLE